MNKSPSPCGVMQLTAAAVREQHIPLPVVRAAQLLQDYCGCLLVADACNCPAELQGVTAGVVMVGHSFVVVFCTFARVLGPALSVPCFFPVRPLFGGL